MSRPYYGDEDIPNYYQQEDYTRQQTPSGHMQSRIPRPSPPREPAPERRRRQAPMRPDQQSVGRSPRIPHDQQYYPEQSAWETSQNLYDGTGYEDEYAQYEQYEQQQWPLPAQPPYSQPSRTHGSPRRAPVRPQRPDEALDYQQPVRNHSRNAGTAPSHQQYTSPPPGSHHGTGQWTGDGYSYPPPSHPPPRRPPPQGPMTAIPQYVEPQMPQQAAYGQANRRAPLGPPPSARRGPSSYYPQVGPVHPIVEETDSMRSSTRNASSIHTGGHDSRTSFVSSNAIPIGIPQGILDNHGERRPNTRDHLPTPEEYETDDASIEAATGRRLDRFAESPPPRDQPSPEVLVRKASIGKKSKPTLTTVKSGERIRKASAEGIASLPSQQRARVVSEDVQPSPRDTQRSRAIAQEQLEGHTQAGADSSDESMVDPSVTVVASDVDLHPVHDRAHSQTPEEILKSGTGLIDASSSESENEVKRKRSKELLGAVIANELHPQRSRARSPLAPDNDERIKSILDSLEKGGAISAAEAEELKKPMSGLSERPGKRRPPRLNVDAVRDAEARGSLTSLPDLIKRATKLASNLDRGKTASRLGMNWLDGVGDEKRRSGSIQDMLSAFPPPLATPTGSRNDRRSLTNWSSRLRHSALPSNSDAGEFKKGGRRCCGMALWLFVLLMLLLFLLVAAAVVVPVILLVVVPDSDSHSTSTAGTCQGKLTCQNGGATILSSSGTCQCLCVNGYTGLNCTDHSEQGCTTTSIGTTDNATVGNAIPRLISGSGNYSIPLDGESLLGLFSASNLDCAAQNALITFNSASSKRDAIKAREPQATNTGDSVTSEGIIFASGTPTATSSSSTATSTSTRLIDNAATIDFARVAVLYVLQASGQLNTASTAQTDLQKYFRNGENANGGTADAKNITLGNGYTCDLTGYTISLSNGTTVGGSS